MILARKESKNNDSFYQNQYRQKRITEFIFSWWKIILKVFYLGRELYKLDGKN